MKPSRESTSSSSSSLSDTRELRVKCKFGGSQRGFRLANVAYGPAWTLQRLKFLAVTTLSGDEHSLPPIDLVQIDYWDGDDFVEFTTDAHLRDVVELSFQDAAHARKAPTLVIQVWYLQDLYGLAPLPQFVGTAPAVSARLESIQGVVNRLEQGQQALREDIAKLSARVEEEASWRLINLVDKPWLGEDRGVDHFGARLYFDQFAREGDDDDVEDDANEEGEQEQRQLHGEHAISVKHESDSEQSVSEENLSGDVGPSQNGNSYMMNGSATGWDDDETTESEDDDRPGHHSFPERSRSRFVTRRDGFVSRNPRRRPDPDNGCEERERREKDALLEQTLSFLPSALLNKRRPTNHQWDSEDEIVASYRDPVPNAHLNAHFGVRFDDQSTRSDEIEHSLWTKGRHRPMTDDDCVRLRIVEREKNVVEAREFLRRTLPNTSSS